MVNRLCHQELRHSTSSECTGSAPGVVALMSALFSFYNMLWLVANDMIIGSAVTAFCIENNEIISHYLAQALKVSSLLVLQSELDPYP